MNKFDKKYMNTAVRMDEAFLEILEEKDFAYVTVKEICERAGVNRSTFYLHYQTIQDLLDESLAYMNTQFLTYFPENKMMDRISDAPQEELYLVQKQYLVPYLTYVQEHRNVFEIAFSRANTMAVNQRFEDMFSHVFNPIMDRLNVPQNDRMYLASFYIGGIMHVIEAWLEQDCSDSVERIAELIERYTSPQRK